MRTYLKTKEVAEMLHISMPTVYRWVKNMKIPYVRRGHRILFVKEQIEEWMSVTNIYEGESFVDQLKAA